MLKKRLFSLLVFSLYLSVAQAKESVWSAQGAGLHLHPGAPAAVQVFRPESAMTGTIARVQLAYRYASSAVLQGSLCHQRSGRCLDLQRAYVDTGFFAGLAADSTFELRLRVWTWAGVAAPIQVSSELTVSYFD